jgi:hypothetical protein
MFLSVTSSSSSIYICIFKLEVFRFLLKLVFLNFQFKEKTHHRSTLGICCSILLFYLKLTMMYFHDEKKLQDSVHNVIILEGVLVKIIDTSEFQRLRNIKQLETITYVYPCANHTRFEHSIG